MVSVASLGSFAGAARENYLDPSSVSRIVGSLEDEIGVRLFQRTTRSLTLTEEGEQYLRRLEPILQDMKQATEEAQRIAAEPRGTLRLTSSIAFGEKVLVPLLPEFKNRYPDLKLELILSDENLDIVSNRIDLAIRLGNAVEGDVIASRLMNTRYKVCVSPDYLERYGEILQPSDLVSHRCLVFTLPDFRSSWLFKNQSGEVFEVQINAGMAISNALALRRAAIEDLGPALLADWLIDEDLESGRLVDLFPDYNVTATTFDTGVWFVYPSRNYLPNKVRVTIDFLRQHLR